jgi:3-mercaptopyruvate sulfurtransferase SseA
MELKLFGHESVSILNGGLRLWHQQGGDLTSEEPKYEV